MGSLGPVIAQETASALPTAATSDEVERQIRINKSTLLEGKDEQARLDAATVMLLNGNGEARKELLDVLRDSGHPEGRAAVCQALTIAREDRKAVANKDQFIEPLIGVLSTETNPLRAELAAQALLMFTYDDIQRQLERLADDSGVAKTARFNAVRALKYQPDDRAIFKLVGLLTSPEVELAAESKKALELLGFNVPVDPNAVQVMAEGVRRRGPEAYLKNPLIMRNWLVSRESRIRELTASVASWEQKYLAALGTLYDGLADESARSAFLLRQISAAEPSVKLWALAKLEELRKGTSKGKLSQELEKTVLSLVSHRDRRVRLKTASLLTLMWELDSTKGLLAHLHVEEDAEVRHGLFVALGNACYYASLPTSSVKVSDAVRKQTLELAVAFLNQDDAQRTRSGADVVRKLLEQDGLKPEDIKKYLTALAGRYRQVSPTANHGLRGELLSAMAVLCAEQSAVRTQAATLYSPVFAEALGDEVESVRQAAVEGLVNIDKVAALKRLRTDFSRDPSAAIRARVVNLAGEIGGQEDIDWLSKKLGAGSEAGPVWEAMLKIFRRLNTEVMGSWTSRLETLTAPNGLSAEQMMSFLALLEQKAQGEKKPEKLREARVKLFGLYAAANDVARATEYMNRVLSAAANERDKRMASSRLLDVCLRSGRAQMDLAGALVENYLSEKDLGPEDPLAKSINTFFQEPPAGADPNALLMKLRQIKVREPEKRTLWRRLLVEWEAFAKAKKPTPIEKANN
jgi:HEAT repeat protein